MKTVREDYVSYLSWALLVSPLVNPTWQPHTQPGLCCNGQTRLRPGIRESAW